MHATPELRKDPIVDRWVIISEEQWNQLVDFPRVTFRRQITDCPFCPGNESQTKQEILTLHSNGVLSQEPDWSLRVVPSKYPSLAPEGSTEKLAEGIFDRMNAIGSQEIIIESPNHSAVLERLPERNVQNCLWAFQKRIIELKKNPQLRYILIFKNHGDAAGATFEHTHSQLLALPVVPELIVDEISRAKQYYEFKERCVWCDIISQERIDGRRIVMENSDFIALCPYAPRVPYETWILPKHHQSHFEDEPLSSLTSAANILKMVLLKIGEALECPPYNMVLHNSTIQGNHNNYYHWHIEIMPKLSRIAGIEQGTGFYINPVPPEEAAETLRSIPNPTIKWPAA